MVYILPERLLALVRPAFDLVLRRIRSLKRCDGHGAAVVVDVVAALAVGKDLDALDEAGGVGAWLGPVGWCRPCF